MTHTPATPCPHSIQRWHPAWSQEPERHRAPQPCHLLPQTLLPRTFHGTHSESPHPRGYRGLPPHLAISFIQRSLIHSSHRCTDVLGSVQGTRARIPMELRVPVRKTPGEGAGMKRDRTSCAVSCHSCARALAQEFWVMRAPTGAGPRRHLRGREMGQACRRP